jgi:YbbR domain-containing protein
VDLSQITQTTLVKAGLALPGSLQLLDPELPEVQVSVEVEEQGKSAKP